MLHKLYEGADTVNDNCTHGDLRIASRSDDESALSSEGRLEICVNNVWGTICDFKYGTRDATVACKQLGYDGQGMHERHTSIYFISDVFIYTSPFLTYIPMMTTVFLLKYLVNQIV